MISGPSGAGKGTLIDAVLPRIPDLQIAISATTRDARAGERDGEDYHFLSRETFLERVGRGDFLEHVEYAGNLYGTLRAEVERILAEDCSAIVEIELRGARAIHRMLPGAVSVFIAPPSADILAERLRARGSESEQTIARRLAESIAELDAQSEFDHVIVNEDRDAAAAALESVLESVLHGESS
ncbi:MAG: guanylate kinase [Actinobacteria bacterium]|nr:guanylate kinase [Actinomycetota bacterium]